MLVLGCSMLFATRGWLALMSEYSERPHRMLIPGVAMVVYGLIVVFNHNIWSGGWPIAVTVAGWLILLKGLGFMFSPEMVRLHGHFPKVVIKMTLRVGGVVLILLSIRLLLTFTGRT